MVEFGEGLEEYHFSKNHDRIWGRTLRITLVHFLFMVLCCQIAEIYKGLNAEFQNPAWFHCIDTNFLCP